MNSILTLPRQDSLIVCLSGTSLTHKERRRISHPLVGGVILFSRNFSDSKQLSNLILEIRKAAINPIMITVDNEGGRVQRFKSDGFTHLPAMLDVATYIEANNLDEQQVFGELGWLMASEAMAHGIDYSLAPVLDIEGGSDVIGDRAFSSSVTLVTKYASSFIGGMQSAGMAAVGKHFPGHGSTKEDSHHFTPIDGRPLEDIDLLDMKPFKTLSAAGLLRGVMPAHIKFSQVDSVPVGYSEVWLQTILKQKIGFDGAVFSDDLSMVGASKYKEQVLSYSERVDCALNAGCDFALICNQPNEVDALLEKIANTAVVVDDRTTALVTKLMANRLRSMTIVELQQSERWQLARGLVENIKSVTSTPTNPNDASALSNKCAALVDAL